MNGESVKDFSGRLDKALTQRKAGKNKTRQSGRGAAIGLAYRLSIELVVGVLVGGFIGWWLDKLFKAELLFLPIMLVLGLAAGVVNMLRTSREMNKRMGVAENEDENLGA